MKFLTSVLLAGILHSCAERPLFRSVTIDEVERLMADSGDSLYILNFWATWCTPCREELPHFDRVTNEFSGQKVKVFLISVDEARVAESKLNTFLRKHKVESEVLWLSASNPNDWISRVSPDWGGNIPITIFVLSSKGIVKIHPDELTYDQLVDYINDLTHE